MNKLEAVQSAYPIPGWHWPQELGWIWEKFQHSRVHVEIGTYCGKSMFVTAAGMHNSPGGHLIISVDCDSDQITLPVKNWPGICRSALIAGIHEQFPDVEVDFWPVASIEASRRFMESGMKADSIYIDGSHYESEVLSDIHAWRSLLRPNGLMAGHDYWPDAPGVMNAVNESFSDFNVFRRIWWARA